ncbi:fibronectin type III domain-containing protein [Streptomyces sp. SLBN-31]|uniref:fibronectin type III domain-containing protein n=1 Tax=Streptomyces sp. SLBN-31 TaxID=2768444 RepID=UPI00114EF686|nr:PA14 domain-containing protein [Streptomyces sp. SLBN-31]TQJ75366.1 PA14 domain-containing protein [Streptomyces sp. SLBN-31]
MNSARRTTASTLVLATAGALLGASVSTASAATTCTSPVFKRQFFGNTAFSGTAKKTDCDSVIDQSWSGAPATGLPKDNFGVRWSVTRDFGSGGPFALTASGLDGIRVYLDGTRRIDLWKNVSSTVQKTVHVTIPSGKHTLRVDYANFTGAAKVRFTYTPRTSAAVDQVKPLVPAGTSLSYDAATGKAKLTWTKNKEMDLAGYRVYRRLKGTSFGSAPLATTTSTSYTDTALPMTGDTYYYEVRAYDKAANTSAGTADQGVTTVDRTAPGEPTGVTAKGTTAGNTVAWQASGAADVHHYEVWGAPEGQQDADGPGLVTGTSFTDVRADTGTAYVYRVYAVDGAGNVSPASAPVTATRPEPSGTPAPAGLTATLHDDRTELRWDLPEDSGQYNVYRRTDGGFSAIGSVRGGGWDDIVAPAGEASYYVVAVDGTGAESAPSDVLTVDRLTRATQTGPAAPSLTLVSAGIPARSPVKVTAAPGAGDEDRVLKGYSWEIEGACGASGTQLSTTGDISWTPPYNGPCTATVYAVDAYGRQSGQSSTLEFFVGR